MFGLVLELILKQFIFGLVKSKMKFGTKINSYFTSTVNMWTFLNPLMFTGIKQTQRNFFFRLSLPE